MSVSPERRRRLMAAATGRTEDLAEIFKTLSDPTRLKILTALLDGEMCVHALCESVGMSQPAVSYQLRILRAAHLVRGRRAGREVFYALDDEHVLQLLSEGLKHVGHPRRRSSG